MEIPKHLFLGETFLNFLSLAEYSTKGKNHLVHCKIPYFNRNIIMLSNIYLQLTIILHIL